MPPDQRDDGVDEWMLRVRIYPDEFSIRRVVAPPSPAELDRLTEAVAALTADPPLDEQTAFAAFAATVGARRALGLWRSWVVPDGAGGWSVDRSAAAEPARSVVHGPVGLPEQLEVWLVHADGTREVGATLALDGTAIGADLDLGTFGDADVLAAGLPETWWLSYDRAVAVGLGVDIDLGPIPPVLDALVVVGVGETPASELVDAHNAGGRLAVLAPGTPTNTVEGEPTTDLGDDADSIAPLLHVDPTTQMSTRAVLTALTGRVPADALPMLGGDLDHYAPGSLAVQGFWPTLWGRALRDVIGAGARELDVARWAIRHLAVEGPRPAIRVGDQPYGLLPASAFGAWVDDTGGELAELEARIVEWCLAWRAGAAAAARAANPWVQGAGTPELLHVLGLHAPSRHWRVRPTADLAVVQAARAMAGMAPMPATEWDRSTARSWTGTPYPAWPIGPAARSGAVPGPPGDAVEDPERLRELCRMHPEPLYAGRHEGLGLVGHLFREALIAGRATIGEAIGRWHDGLPVELGQALPLDDEDTYRDHVMRGDDTAVAELALSDVAGGALARRFLDVQEALEVIADLWEPMRAQLFRAVLAALDTASVRVDPWLTGLAERRLARMIDDGAPFLLGAYGWVDAPAPYDAATGAALAPGPTAAGLLHTPSHEQALTAALLRDAAVRRPGDDRWQLRLDSAKVRAAVSLAERVRLGVHPYEALGLEVEEIAGDWDVVRVLREEHPLADGQQERRVCDGVAVLQAARVGTLPAGLPADLAARLAPLDDVLDTYADLLVADGIHALVSGRGDLANAAMEAAAGLGAPPDLRAIRTPRGASTVRVAAWVLLDPGDDVGAAPDPSPGAVADPAFGALVTAELGPGALDADDPVVVDARRRLAAVLGGGDAEAPVPTLTGGTYEGRPATADSELRSAVAADLSARLGRLRQLAQGVLAGLATLDPDDPGASAALASVAGRWAIDLSAVVPSDPVAETASWDDVRAALAATLAARVDAATTAVPVGAPPVTTDAAINVVRGAIRTLAGRRELPIVPIVDRSLVPVLRPRADLDQAWLELAAAVRPRLEALEARQLDPARSPWPAAIAGPDGTTDPWHPAGPVLVAYGPGAGVVAGAGAVGVVALDAWTDSVPSRRHATAAAFGFNAPKSRAPQAVLLAVPPDRSQRLTTEGVVDVVLEVRELAHARASRPTDRAGLPYATPAPVVHAVPPVNFLEGWP